MTGSRNDQVNDMTGSRNDQGGLLTWSLRCSPRVKHREAGLCQMPAARIAGKHAVMDYCVIDVFL